MDIDPLDQAIYDMVHDFRDPVTGKRGVPAMAHRLGCRTGTLQNEVNRTMPSHVPNVHKVRAMMLVAQDFRPLYQLARDCGHLAWRKRDYAQVSDQALLDALLHIDREKGDVARELARALEDGQVDPEERDRLLEEIDDVRAALCELEARIREMTVTRPRAVVKRVG